MIMMPLNFFLMSAECKTLALITTASGYNAWI